MDDYDITQAFTAIENELMASMIRNMRRHKVEEVKEDKQWAMWQAMQLESLERYKNENQDKYGQQFKDLNQEIEALIRTARDEGEMAQEIAILSAIRKGFPAKKVSAGSSAEFFKLNERKLEVLIDATTNDMNKAETAVLRMSNDRYRQVIFNAQVYANTGAGTYEKAVDMATKDFIAAGINCVEYKNGARHTLSDYADMAIRTAGKRAYLQGEGSKRQEWGIHTVIMNKRGNPCPKCLPFVGKILIDDVWSGGSAKDGPYPLMSEAIAAGLYHPNCRDSHTTYFPGITTTDGTWTKEELENIGVYTKNEARKQYAKHQEERFGRLAEHSLDEENRKSYAEKAARWRKESGKTYSDKSRLKETTNDDIIKKTKSETISRVRRSLKEGKVEYIEVHPLNNTLTTDQIVKRLGGGDTTNGSCSSLAFAYIGNKNGLDVLDFRGGKSQAVFATNRNIIEIANLTNGQIVKNTNDFKAVDELLKTVIQGKEYYLSTGKHAAIIRKTESSYEYLELQSAIHNGYKRLTNDVLKKRFGCKKTHSIFGEKLEAPSVLINADSLKGNREFEKILGYINTRKKDQLKGVRGNVK